MWTSGGWRFAPPIEGMTCWIIAESVIARFSGAFWAKGVQTATVIQIDGNQVVGPRRPAIADPIGGASPDSEARLAITTILATLRIHGLIAA